MAARSEDTRILIYSTAFTKVLEISVGPVAKGDTHVQVELPAEMPSGFYWIAAVHYYQGNQARSPLGRFYLIRGGVF
jgi:hypothetical protein